MPKTKAGRLTPQIHQMKKDLEEKKDSLSAEERRSLLHRLKRTQRKAHRIQKEEDRQVAMAKKPEKAEEKPEEKVEEKPEEKAEEKAESKGSDDEKAEA